MMIRMAVMVLALTTWAELAPAAETAVSAVAAAPETVNLMNLPNPLSVQIFVDYVGNQLKLKFIYDPEELAAAGNIVVEPNQPVKVSELYGLLENVLRTKNLVMIRAKEGDWIRILPESKSGSFTQLPVPHWKAPAAAASPSSSGVSNLPPPPGPSGPPSHNIVRFTGSKTALTWNNSAVSPVKFRVSKTVLTSNNSAASAASAAKAAGPEEMINFSPMPNPLSVRMFVEYVGSKLKLKFIYDPEDLEAAGNTTIQQKRMKLSELYGLLEKVLREKKLVMIKTNVDWIRVLPESKVEKATDTTTTSSSAAASGAAALRPRAGE